MGVAQRTTTVNSEQIAKRMTLTDTVLLLSGHNSDDKQLNKAAQNVHALALSHILTAYR